MSSTLPSPILVGRERERALLCERLDAALVGNGGLVLIGGEAGIGKTALAEAICHAARDHGALALVGRCYDLTETPPYGPWVELFAGYQPIAHRPPPPAAFSRHGTVGASTSQSDVFMQMRDFLVALVACQPVLFLLDDLHWADPASLDLLRALARELAALPVLIVAAYRAEEVTRQHPLYRLLPVLVREARADRLDLARLGDDAVSALVVARHPLAECDAARLVAYLQTRAEGNPFYLGELLRSLEAERVLRRGADGWAVGDLTRTRIPALLRQVIDSRLARLGDTTQRLLVIAAVIGQEIPFDLWSAVSGSDEPTLLATIEPAVAVSLLDETPDGTGARFPHALVREVVYAGIRPARRRALHRQVAEALIAHRGEPDPDAVAYHLQCAGDDRAVTWLLQAGKRAQAAYASLTAVARYEAVLALMERAGMDAGERGWLALRCALLLPYADVGKARAYIDAAQVLAVSTGDRTLAAFARFHRGLYASHAGDVAYGVPEMEAGIGAIAALSDAERAHFAALGMDNESLDKRAVVALWRVHVGRYREAYELGEQLAAEAWHDEWWGHGLAAAYAVLGMPDAAATMHVHAHDLCLQRGNIALASITARREIELVALPYRTQEIAYRRRLAEGAEAEWARASGTVPSAFPPRFMRLPLLLVEGPWDDAVRLAMMGSNDARGNIGSRMNALRYLAALALLRGDTERARWAVRERFPAGSATVPGTVAYFDTAIIVLRVAVALALDAGDLPDARRWLDAHDRWLEWSESVLGQSEGQALWARYHRQAGDARRARDSASRALAHATEPRQPLALLAAHRLLGELDTDLGRVADAATHLDTALALADACAAPYERALTHLARAAWFIAVGQRADAAATLDDVRAICDPLGAKPALARADALAARLPRHDEQRVSDPDGLSRREGEVLRLIAAGKSNREMAETLSISVRTVERHVENIYRKIDVHSKADATAYAYRHRLR